MPLSTDVTLSKHAKPQFPRKCIVCHAEPDTSVKIAQNSPNWLLNFFVPILMLFGRSWVEIPICQSCKLRFRIQRWGRELVWWILVIVAIWLVVPRFSDWSGFTNKIVGGVFVLLTISPAILLDVVWPRIFDTTAQGDKVDYEFADAGYAAEFHELNKVHEIDSDLQND